MYHEHQDKKGDLLSWDGMKGDNAKLALQSSYGARGTMERGSWQCPPLRREPMWIVLR
jgi:hypothetical protein